MPAGTLALAFVVLALTIGIRLFNSRGLYG
jgi:hypothetical protein